MRILEARFKNLNSLRGEWRIDFTDPAYTGDGIFCITGPTGAGKTTIMDAICLALYGRTPRLERINKSENEIMARHTGECFAEVCFETKAGRFRCHWSQHRARRKPTGELQNPRHEIVDDGSGQVLESKLREVALLIENVTGMDFDRFTRSMLLAQGGFAAFLQAPPDERSPLLEQITGTEIYSRISMKVHQRRGEERKRLENIQAALGSIELLSAAEEDELSKRLEEKQAGLKDTLTGVEIIKKALAWYEGMENLKDELVLIEEQGQDYRKRQNEFAPALYRLKRAYKALALEGDYQQVAALRKQQGDDNLLLGKLRQELPAREALVQKIARRRDDLEAGAEQAKAGQKDEAEKIKLVREIDLKLDYQQQLIDKMAVALADTQKSYDEGRQNAEVIGEALLKANRAGQELAAYLEQHTVDAGLGEDLAVIRQLLAELQRREVADRLSRKQLEAAGEAINESRKSCEEAAAVYDDSSTGLANAEQEYRQLNEQIQDLLGGRELENWRQEMEELKQKGSRLEEARDCLEQMNAARPALQRLREQLRGFREERLHISAEIEGLSGQIQFRQQGIEHLEKEVVLLNRIHDLEEERKSLRDGETCPLCGATEHPFARGNIPALKESEALLRQARQEMEGLNRLMVKGQLRQTELDKDLEKTGQEIGEKEAWLRAEEKRWQELQSNLGLTAEEEDLPAQIGAQIELAEQRIAFCHGIISAVEQRQKAEKRMYKVMDKARRLHTEAGRTWQEAKFNQQTAQREYNRRLEEIEARKREIAELQKQVRSALAPYETDATDFAKLNRTVAALDLRWTRWQETRTAKIENEKESHALQAELKGQRTDLTRLEDELKRLGQEQAKLHKIYDDLKIKRCDLYGDKEPDAEEERWRRQVEQAEKKLQEVEREQQEARQELSNGQNRINLLSDSLRERGVELLGQEKSFEAVWRRAGFGDEAEYRSAVLSTEERQRLEEEAEALRREESEIKSRREDREQKLRVEEEKRLSDESYEMLTEKLALLTTEQDELQQEVYLIKIRLEDDRERKTRHREQLEVMVAQRQECERWDRLHELIGSADGKKYRNFAQGLTFDILIAHANRQLQKMSDRYLLITDLAHPLEINVIDNYQGGEIRSAKNLSGGESFIVSLALALGLSGMASRKVNIDTLFLDEGFGTLDQDALDSALETLAGIRQEGKMIGIISHVPGLQERISARIEVMPKSGGYSVLTGPGCISGVSQ